jgi:hypothetical protein
LLVRDGKFVSAASTEVDDKRDPSFLRLRPLGFERGFSSIPEHDENL